MRRLLSVIAALALLTGCTGDPAPTPSDESVSAAPTGPSCLVKKAQASSVPSTNAGKPLPAMAVKCFDGGRYVDAALLGSEPTIINFWASWCEPCRTELPAFQRFVTAAGGRVRVIGVVTKDPKVANARSVIDDFRLTFTMLEDRNGQFASSLGQVVGKPLANALPGTVFVAPGGRVVFAHQGKTLEDADLRALTAEHLGIEVGM